MKGSGFIGLGVRVAYMAFEVEYSMVLQGEAGLRF